MFGNIIKCKEALAKAYRALLRAYAFCLFLMTESADSEFDEAIKQLKFAKSLLPVLDANTDCEVSK